MTIETALYRHFAADGALLYVGISKNPLVRYDMHACRSPWVRDIARIDIEWHPTTEAAMDAEGEAIRTEGPIHNKRVPRRKPPVHKPQEEVIPPPFNQGYLGCVIAEDPEEREAMIRGMVRSGVSRNRIFFDMRRSLKAAQHRGARLFVAGTRDLHGALEILRARKVHIRGIT